MDLSILSLLAQATLVAKAVLVVLLFMSVFSWALMFCKWMNIRAALKKAADGMDRFNHARDLREAVQSLGGDPDSPLYTCLLYTSLLSARLPVPYGKARNSSSATAPYPDVYKRQTLARSGVMVMPAMPTSTLPVWRPGMMPLKSMG